MSTISIARNALRSQTVRDLIGERTIDIFASLTSSEGDGGDGDGGFLGFLFSGAKRLIAGAFRLLDGFVKWALGNVWEIILTTTFEIAYFDWNQTDATIRAQMASNEIQIFGALGELLGVGSVWIASIGLAGLATLKWPVLAGKVLLDLAEEGGEEVRAELRSLLSQARNSLVRNSILSSILLSRSLNIFGLSPVSQQREPWSIAGSIEERVESIDDAKLRTFVENFLEGAVDALIEVGYVVTYSIEDFYRAQKLAQVQVLGPNRGVILTPDDRVPDERMILTGTQELAKQSIESVIMNHRLVANRDIGQLVGMPLNEYIRGGVQRRKLTIVFKSKEKPPWTPLVGQDLVREVSYTIPECENSLTWNELKLAAKAWNWGKFRCTANLDDGRQMAVYGSTPTEAEAKLRELQSLSTKQILTVSVSEEKDRHPNLRKNAVRMYPAYATLVVRRPTNIDRGIVDQAGQRYSEESIRIELWPDEEPSDFVPLP